MLSFLLNGSGKTDPTTIVMIIVLVVLFAGMMAISIIPQKKKQKEYAAMQNAIKVGTRVMTIGRLVGTVVAINTDNTLEVDIGTKGSPVIIVINREGIGLNLDAQQVAPNSKGDIKPTQQEGDVDSDNTAAPAEKEAPAEEKASDVVEENADEKADDDAI